MFAQNHCMPTMKSTSSPRPAPHSGCKSACTHAPADCKNASDSSAACKGAGPDQLLPYVAGRADLELMALCTRRSSAASYRTAPPQYLMTPAGGCSPSSGCHSSTRASRSCGQTRSEATCQQKACWFWPNRMQHALPSMAIRHADACVRDEALSRNRCYVTQWQHTYTAVHCMPSCTQSRISETSRSRAPCLRQHQMPGQHYLLRLSWRLLCPRRHIDFQCRVLRSHVCRVVAREAPQQQCLAPTL